MYGCSGGTCHRQQHLHFAVHSMCHVPCLYVGVLQVRINALAIEQFMLAT